MIDRNGTADSLSSTFTGRVRCVNPKGIKLEDHDDWLNFSKFAPAIIAPERGDTVTVSVDKAGFIRSVDIRSAIFDATNGHAAPPKDARTRQETPRDVTITRLAVLKAAAEFGAARPQLKSGDVLAIAESWERWVLRSGDDLTDAL